MKATKQYFPVVVFIMLYKVVLSFESVHCNLNCVHSQRGVEWSIKNDVPQNIIRVSNSWHIKFKSRNLGLAIFWAVSKSNQPTTRSKGPVYFC